MKSKLLPALSLACLVALRDDALRTYSIGHPQTGPPHFAAIMQQLSKETVRAPCCRAGAVKTIVARLETKLEGAAATGMLGKIVDHALSLSLR